jgi:BON domain
MTHPHPSAILRAMRRSAALLTLVATLLAAGALAAGCGSGDRVAITPSTLPPITTPAGSLSPGGVPSSPGASTSASASPTPVSTISGSPLPGFSDIKGQPTDAKIKADIIRRMGLYAQLFHDVHIVVHVQDGVVYLYGKVRNDGQKSQIEWIAQTEPGVKYVKSYIVVQGVGGY